VSLGFTGTSWLQHGVRESAGDRFSSGVSPSGTPAFFPLFRLLVMRDRGPILLLRDSPEPEDPKQLLAPLYPPWGALDEEGEKVPGSEGWGAGSEEEFMREVEEDERRFGEMMGGLAGGKGSAPVSPPSSV